MTAGNSRFLIFSHQLVTINAPTTIAPPWTTSMYQHSPRLIFAWIVLDLVRVDMMIT